MSLIFRLPVILEESREAYKNIKAVNSFYPVECINKRAASYKNILARGDNLEFLQHLLKEQELMSKVQLIYMDPPFYSKASYDAVIKLESSKMQTEKTIRPMAYDDSWKTGMEEYLRMLCIRFFLIKDLLADEGCFWIHLDWHVVHYVKVLLDEIFGENNLVNEIIWNYKSGGTGKRSFSKKHDTLLFYSKTKKYYFHPLKEKSYNRGYKPYRFKGVEEYEDHLGWYTMVNMKDVWQIDMVGRTSSERTGYATQKPQQLLSRIVESCTREGDLCADIFGGSGTLAAVAHDMGRRWISCDIGGIAVAGTAKRMVQRQSTFTIMAERPDISQERLLVDLKTQSMEDSKEKRIKITLKGYDFNIKGIPLEEKDKDAIRAFKRKDPLQLLEYWSVDFDYDGKLHNPDHCFVKGKGPIETICRGVAQKDAQVSIRAMDIFGNATLKVFNMGEEK